MGAVAPAAPMAPAPLVNAFPFKNKDKSHIFHAKATFTLCSAAPCLFCFEAICDRYFFKLNCFKLIG
jgi:hypothetical protein